MDNLPSILGPQALGWAAARLTLLTFVCADMRRLRKLPSPHRRSLGVGSPRAGHLHAALPMSTAAKRAAQ